MPRVRRGQSHGRTAIVWPGLSCWGRAPRQDRRLPRGSSTRQAAARPSRPRQAFFRQRALDDPALLHSGAPAVVPGDRFRGSAGLKPAIARATTRRPEHAGSWRFAAEFDGGAWLRYWRGAVPTSAWILRPGLTSARASRSLRGALRRAPRSGQSSPDRRSRAAAETPGCVLRALVGAPPGRRSQRPAPKASAATRPQGGTVPAAWAVRQATSHVRTTGNHWVSGYLAPAPAGAPLRRLRRSCVWVDNLRCSVVWPPE
jgi:hypothetical protein